MARRRMLPTNFFKDPDIVTLSRDAQLILLGLTLLADDEGRECAHAYVLKHSMSFSVEEIETALQDLVANDLLLLYQAGRHRYYYLTRWHKWQTLGGHVTPSLYPAPPEQKPAATPSLILEIPAVTEPDCTKVTPDNNKALDLTRDVLDNNKALDLTKDLLNADKDADYAEHEDEHEDEDYDEDQLDEDPDYDCDEDYVEDEDYDCDEDYVEDEDEDFLAEDEDYTEEEREREQPAEGVGEDSGKSLEEKGCAEESSGNSPRFSHIFSEQLHLSVEESSGNPPGFSHIFPEQLNLSEVKRSKVKREEEEEKDNNHPDTSSFQQRISQAPIPLSRAAADAIQYLIEKIPDPDAIQYLIEKIPDLKVALSPISQLPNTNAGECLTENRPDPHIAPSPTPSSRAADADVSYKSLTEPERETLARKTARLLPLSLTDALRRRVIDYASTPSLCLSGEADAARAEIDDTRKNRQRQSMSPTLFRRWLKRKIEARESRHSSQAPETDQRAKRNATAPRLLLCATQRHSKIQSVRPISRPRSKKAHAGRPTQQRFAPRSLLRPCLHHLRKKTEALDTELCALATFLLYWQSMLKSMGRTALRCPRM